MTRARDNSFNPFNNQAAGKNLLINGAFDYWQRGTTFTDTGASNKYTADRWGAVRGGWASGQKTERIDLNKSELSISALYGARISRIQGNTSTVAYSLNHALEEQVVTSLAGQTVTFSFYARKSASYTGTSIIISLLTGTGQFGPGDGVPGLVVNELYVTPLTTWTRHTITANVPTNAKGLSVAINATCQGTAPANEYLEIAGAQLELGSNATQFSRAGGTIGGELALCQRYYQKSYNLSDVPGTAGAGSGKYNFMTPNRTDNYAMEFNTFFKTFMRATPSVSVFSSVTGTSGVVRDEGTGNDRAIIVKNGGESNFQIEGNTTTTANALHSYQWIASAEL